MTEKRFEKRMNFNINLPSNRCFKTEEVIVDRKEDCYEALSINDIVYRLNLLDNLEQENQKLDEKVCCLTMDLITTKSYKQLEKECNRFKKENEQLKQQLADVDSLIYDLGHDEMRRQYEEIFKGDV